MASSAVEELRVVDSDMDGATETLALQATGERGQIMLVWVASEPVHDDK